MKKLVWALGTLVLIAVLVLISAELSLHGSTEAVRLTPPGPEAAASHAAFSRANPEHEEGAPRMSSRASVVAASDPSATGDADGGEQEDQVVSGRVLNVEGHPVPDVLLGLANQKRVRIASNADGSFELEAEGLRRGLVVRSPERVLVGTGWRTEPGGRTLIVIVASATTLTGTVAYADGIPAEGVIVSFDVSAEALGSFPIVLDQRTEGVSRHVLTDEAGRFELRGVPRVFGLLEARKSEDLRAGKALRPEGDSVSLVLRGVNESPAYEVCGIVVDGAGQRVAGATVRFGSSETTTTRDGSFTILSSTLLSPDSPLPDDATSFTLVATYGEAAPAVIEGFGALLEDPRARNGVVLQLGERALAIEGRVLNADGDGMEGIWITLADPTPMGNSSETVETLGLPWMAIRTDAEGKFRHGGLLERSYRVCAVHRPTGLVVVSDPVHAGTTTLVLRLPPDPWREVRGIVRSRFGAPVPGVTVGVHRVLSDNGMLAQNVTADPVVTDVEGKFRIERAPRVGASLAFFCESIDSVLTAIPDGDLDEEIEIIAPLRLRFRLELAGIESADKFAVLDEQGNELRVTRLNAHSRGMGRRWPLSQDLSLRVFEVGDTATQLVLYDEDQVVRRVPLELVPGEVTLVRG